MRYYIDCKILDCALRWWWWLIFFFWFNFKSKLKCNKSSSIQRKKKNNKTNLKVERIFQFISFYFYPYFYMFGFIWNISSLFIRTAELSLVRTHTHTHDTPITIAYNLFCIIIFWFRPKKIYKNGKSFFFIFLLLFIVYFI